MNYTKPYAQDAYIGNYPDLRNEYKDSEELNHILKLEDSYGYLGSFLVNQCRDNTEYVLNLYSALNRFASVTSLGTIRRKQIQDLIDELDDRRKNNRYKFYAELYCKDEEKLSFLNSCYHSSDSKLSEISVTDEFLSDESNYKYLGDFLKWCQYSLDKDISKIFSEKYLYNEREREIIKRRLNNEKVDDLSEVFGVSRQRIYQIESKLKTYFSKLINPAFMKKIIADLDGKPVVRFEDLKLISNEHAEELLYFLSNTSKKISYSDNFNGLLLLTSDKLEKLENYIGNLPDVIDESMIENLILELDSVINESLVEYIFYDEYEFFCGYYLRKTKKIINDKYLNEIEINLSKLKKHEKCKKLNSALSNKPNKNKPASVKKIQEKSESLRKTKDTKIIKEINTGTKTIKESNDITKMMHVSVTENLSQSSDCAFVVKANGTRKNILFSAVKKKWNFAVRELVKQKGYCICDSQVVFWMTAYNGAKGIVFVWDCIKNDYIHFSDGSLIMKAIIKNGYIYKMMKTGTSLTSVKVIRTNLKKSSDNIELKVSIDYDIDRYKEKSYDLITDADNVYLIYKKQKINLSGN